MALCSVCGKPNMDDARFCFSCGTALLQSPPVKVEIKSPLEPAPMMAPAMSGPMPVVPPTYAPRQLARQGSCHYHAELPATFICSRCGRSICMSCTRQYGMLTFCSECYHGLEPKIGYGSYQYQSEYQQDQGHGLF
jgi:hypothetical protein